MDSHDTLSFQVKSNRHWNNFLYGYELTSKEKEEYDYLDLEDIETHSFLRYKNNTYALADFLTAEHVDDWDGIFTDTFFSGVVIKLSDDGEQYQVGTLLA